MNPNVIGSQVNKALLTGDRTGRLLKYYIGNKRVEVLLTGLGLPVGVAVSQSGDYVIVSEYLYNRTMRYWVRGAKAKTAEVFANFPGKPDNIKRNPKGDFLVPINNVTQPNSNMINSSSVALRLGEDGAIQEVFSLDPGPQYSEFQEFVDRKFAIGTLDLSYVEIIS